MSEVYLCLLPGEGGFRKRVALKIVHPRHAEDPRFRALFAAEARLAASLSHPNLIQVFDFGKEGNAYYLAMEYVEGWDLAQAAAQARQLRVPIPPGVWRHWVEGIWSGLLYLHEKGIVHRDVSPGNVLLDRMGAVKLADFGISRAAAESEEGEGALAGKAAYFSPERALGEAATPSSDLFAAAAISAELLIGRRLFDGGGTEELLGRVRRFDDGGLVFPAAAEGFAEAVRQGIAADPAKRYRGAGDFLSALAARGPLRATPTEIARYWDLLFPHADEEATAPPLAERDDPAPSMVKEPPPLYGMGGKTLKAGAAAALFAITAGGVLLWMERIVPGHPVPRTAVSVPEAPRETGGGREAARQRAQAVPLRGSLVSPPRGFAANASGPADPAPMLTRLVRIETEPEGADILLENGETIGRTPARLELSLVGGRGIVLSREGFERKTIPAGALEKLDTFRTELDPILGTVEAIQAIPWARVYVGERILGDTPLIDVRLPAGEHRLRFVNEPLGVDKAQKVVVRPGKNPKIIVRMTGDAR